MQNQNGLQLGCLQFPVPKAIYLCLLSVLFGSNPCDIYLKFVLIIFNWFYNNQSKSALDYTESHLAHSGLPALFLQKQDYLV